MSAKHPLMRDLERLVCYVNCWADEDEHKSKGRPFQEGYEQACLDILPRLQELAPDWLDTWRAEFVNRERASA